MSGRQWRGQVTLDGSTVEYDPPTCQYYAGCEGDATHYVERLVYAVGIVEQRACETCLAEHREFYPEGDRDRPLPASELLAWGEE